MYDLIHEDLDGDGVSAIVLCPWDVKGRRATACVHWRLSSSTWQVLEQLEREDLSAYDDAQEDLLLAGARKRKAARTAYRAVSISQSFIASCDTRVRKRHLSHRAVDRRLRAQRHQL